MGTRNLTAVMLDGEYKIAQYGQWDGYPSGQGAIVLAFLKKKGNLEKLKAALKRVRFLKPEGRDKKFLDSYNKDAKMPDKRTAKQKQWFKTFISRDIGGEILENIVSTKDKKILLEDTISFAGESLFCEYAYVVDLDKNTFEVFQGFNKEKVIEGRFVSGDPTLEKNEGYEPVSLLKLYKLTKLPSLNKFLKDLANEKEGGE